MTQFTWLSEQNPANLLIVVAALSLAPICFLSLTSFLKISIVFGIVKNAFGVQGIPPAAVTGLLAFGLTIQIMAPTAKQMIAEVTSASAANTISKGKAAESWDTQFVILSRAAKPLESFLRDHSAEREREFFASGELQKVNGVDQIPGENLFTLIPAFITSEMTAGFRAGFLLFLPFLIIDLIVSNILVALGLTLVNPVSISLPLKLLLFVLCDGWFLICRGLVLSYSA